MAHISTYAKRAKAYRRQHPNISWQSAMKHVASGHKSRPKKRRVSGTAAVGTTAVGKRRRKRVSGTAAVGSRRRHRARRGGFLGSTKGTIMEVLKMGAGVAGGIFFTHKVLRPAENWVAQKYPIVAKLMAATEVLIGGVMIIKAKRPIFKAIGMGILSGGTYGLLKQFNIHYESPAVSGVGEFTHVTLPMSDQVAGQLGSLRDKLRRVRKWHLDHNPANLFHKNAQHNRSRMVADTDQIAGSDEIGDVEISGRYDPYKELLFAGRSSLTA